MQSTTVVHLILIHVYTNIEARGNKKKYGRRIQYSLCQVPRLDTSSFVVNVYLLS